MNDVNTATNQTIGKRKLTAKESQILSRNINTYGHYMTYDLKFLLRIEYIYGFRLVLRTNSNHFAMQHNFLVFLTKTNCVYCAVRNETRTITNRNVTW